MKILNKLTKNRKNPEKNVEIRYLQDSLLIDNSILVLGDLHIGYEEHLTKSGIFPRVQLKEIIEKLNSIFWDLAMEGKKIKKVIILGDLKHEFNQISEAEWSETIKLLDYLDEKIIKIKVGKKEDQNSSVNDKNIVNNQKQEERIILIKGNHDNILGPIAKKKEVVLKESYEYEGICFMHGDKLGKGIIDKKCFDGSKILILGHLHPAITLSDDYKREKYKCFLNGKWKINGKTKEVYIIPSFSPISIGYDLNSIENSKENDKKDFLIVNNKELLNFKIIIYNNKDKKEYDFGKLKKITF